jgi:hypothetical protein
MDIKEIREMVVKQVLSDIEEYKGLLDTQDNHCGELVGILPFDKYEWQRFKTLEIERRK